MKTDNVARFSVSLPSQLLDDLDQMVADKSYDNRSLAVADMIRRELVEHRADLVKETVAATITLVFDHHRPHVQEQLTALQHDHEGLIVSAMHVHLDHHNCLEVLVARGKAKAVKKLADQLIATKGVKFGRLAFSNVGDLPG